MGIDFENDCVEVSGGESAAGSDADQPVENRPRLYQPGIEVAFRGERLKLAGFFRPNLKVMLLGRDDFFNYFKVSFDQRRLRFTLERYP